VALSKQKNLKGHFIARFWGFQGAVEEDSDIMGCYAVSVGGQLSKFRENVVPSSSVTRC